VTSEDAPVSEQPDYYRLLRILPTASEAQIKRAYRLLAKTYHPDRVPANRRGWARKHMASVNVAYETLSDPQKRALYDRRNGLAGTPRDRRRTSSPAARPVAPGEGKPSGNALWPARRARERSRRQRIERWRVAAWGSAAVLGIGLLLTLLTARALPGYLLAAAVNGSALAVLLASLIQINQ
jgi:curved DNA-binding protein CbpA